jgi:hypothetical protein
MCYSLSLSFLLAVISFPGRFAQSRPAPPVISSSPAYEVRVWVLRPVARRSPSDIELSAPQSPWHIVQMPRDLPGRASNVQILEALRRANPGFRFESVVSSSSSIVRTGDTWHFDDADITHISLILPKSPASDKTGVTLNCRGEATFAPVHDEPNGPRAAGGCRYAGVFGIPLDRIVAFNAGQRFSRVPPASPSSQATSVHVPRDLLLLAIRTQMNERSMNNEASKPKPAHRT